MRYLAILISVLMLAACASEFQKAGYKAVEADCRLKGYIPGTLDYRDCVTVGKHEVDVYDMQQRAYMFQQYQALGAMGAPQPAPAPVIMPQPVAPKTQFCYPGQGFTYCQ